MILTAAREIKSQYEFSAHARLAREAGVSDKTIRGHCPRHCPGRTCPMMKRYLSRYGIELLRDRKISDATFNAVKDTSTGIRGVVDVTVLIGHYLLVGQILAAFDVELAPGVAPELPE